MDSFSLLYSETKKQVLTMIFVPLLLCAIYIITLEAVEYDKHFPLWASLLIFFAALASSMIFFMKKVINVPSSVTITTDGINIELVRANLFHPKQNIRIFFKNIEHLAEDVNTQNDSKYFTITTKNPAKSILIMQGRKMKEEEVEKFAALLHNNIDLYNHNREKPVDPEIKEGSFYDATWARILTYTIYTILLILPLAAFMGAQIRWYKIVQVYVLGIAWLIPYHVSRNKSRLKKL
jgi:hypothetical protein